MESPDFTDPIYGMPVLQPVRRGPAASRASRCTRSMSILIDLQDLGLPHLHLCDDFALHPRSRGSSTARRCWVLDRPNPAGRPVEEARGCLPGWESFVGAGPMVMRHGLTMGEMGHWFIRHFGLDVDYRVIAIGGLGARRPPASAGPRAGWINPSPNAANVNMARAYAGTVMVEGATLSEGRGTTRPLELFGAPDIDAKAVIAEMHRSGAAMARRVQAARYLVPADLPQACRPAQ